MVLRVYWQLCQKYGVKCANVWYNKVPGDMRVTDNGHMGLWWDRSVETTQKIECYRSDDSLLMLVVVEVMLRSTVTQPTYNLIAGRQG